jgi:hypothetical protein
MSIIKTVYNEETANMILNRRKLNLFFLLVLEEDKCGCLELLHF